MALLAAPTLLWLVARVAGGEGGVGGGGAGGHAGGAEGDHQGLADDLEDAVSIILTPAFLDPDLRLCSHHVFSKQDRNSLSIRVLVSESLASPLEMWSKETWRSSYARLTAPDTAGAAVRAHCRKRKGMTQSLMPWRNSRRTTRRRFWWLLHRGRG